MITVVQLDLPPPSEHLVEMFLKYVQDQPLDADAKRWLDEFQGNDCNTSLHYYSRPGVLSDEFTKQLQLEYQKFFAKHTIGPVSGINRPADDRPSCQPPHCDRGRRFGIHFYLELGGNNVSTVFYDYYSPVREQSINLKYSDVAQVRDVVFDSGTWYAFPTDWCHSVENIQALRCFFGIRLKQLGKETYDLDYSLDDMIRDYPELIKLYL
jgi:hypothetical protein